MLENRHIIAALRDVEAVKAVLSAPTEVVYLLLGNPLNIRELVQAMLDKGKLPLVNLDLLTGFSRDLRRTVLSQLPYGLYMRNSDAAISVPYGTR